MRYKWVWNEVDDLGMLTPKNWMTFNNQNSTAHIANATESDTVPSLVLVHGWEHYSSHNEGKLVVHCFKKSYTD